MLVYDSVLNRGSKCGKCVFYSLIFLTQNDII